MWYLNCHHCSIKECIDIFIHRIDSMFLWLLYNFHHSLWARPKCERTLPMWTHSWVISVYRHSANGCGQNTNATQLNALPRNHAVYNYHTEGVWVCRIYTGSCTTFDEKVANICTFLDTVWRNHEVEC